MYSQGSSGGSRGLLGASGVRASAAGGRLLSERAVTPHYLAPGSARSTFSDERSLRADGAPNSVLRAEGRVGNSFCAPQLRSANRWLSASCDKRVNLLVLQRILAGMPVAPPAVDDVTI
jgi:hypothetical protein